MRQMLLLSVLLLSASWMIAQNTPAQTNQKGYGQTQTSTGSQTTVEGCLSSSDGKYMLTDSQGKTFALMGDSSVLAKHVGHEVKITGAESAAGNNGGASGESSGTMSNQANEPSIEVNSVKHISKTCKSGGGMMH